MPFGKGLLKKARKKEGRRREKKKRLTETLKVKRGQGRCRETERVSQRDEGQRDAHKEWKSEQLLFRISHSVIWTTKNTLHKTAGIRKEESLLFQNKEMRLHVRAFRSSPHKSWLFSLFCGATDIFFGRGGWQKERHKWREKVRNKNGHSDRQTKTQTKSQAGRGSDWHASPRANKQAFNVSLPAIVVMKTKDECDTVSLCDWSNQIKQMSPDVKENDFESKPLELKNTMTHVYLLSWCWCGWWRAGRSPCSWRLWGWRSRWSPGRDLRTGDGSRSSAWKPFPSVLSDQRWGPMSSGPCRWSGGRQETFSVTHFILQLTTAY